jgi:hypothetical protein
MKFIIGIVCELEMKKSVRKYLNKYGYDRVEIFNKLPHLCA